MLKNQKTIFQKRSLLYQTIRKFFDSLDYTEVETPILQASPTIDTHIHGFATDLKSVDLHVKKTLYLQTSPEFEMKKLLVDGHDRIYQICKVFRNGEFSKLHRPEFTMLEWYETGTDYTHLMNQCDDLFFAITKAFRLDAFGKAERLSVVDAFHEYAAMDLENYLDDLNGFQAAVRQMGLHVSNDDAWDDVFHRVMADKIEPYLGRGQPTILYDYPVCMASLSRVKPDDARFAERFEIYINGIELANAFSELTDATEQRIRYKAAMAEKQRLYGETYPIEEEFMAALQKGLPACAGIALGLDRLLMICLDADEIETVMPLSS